jgi:hypothetical protein
MIGIVESFSEHKGHKLVGGGAVVRELMDFYEYLNVFTCQGY